MNQSKKDKIKKILYGLLVIIWMVAIFNFSSQQSEESSNTSETVIRVSLNKSKNFRELDEEKQKTIIENFQHPIRKLAHFIFYTIGGLLIFNFVNTFNTCVKNKMLISIYIGTIYAISDETHQLFIAGRSGQITDVFIDTTGVIVGCIVMNLLNKWRQKIKWGKTIST